MKFDNFIKKIKEESDNIQITDLCSQIIALQKKKNRKRPLLKLFMPIMSFALILIFIFSRMSFLDKPDLSPEISNVAKTYAFEALSATNMILGSQDYGIRHKLKNENDFDLIATNINRYILTIDQFFNQNDVEMKEYILENEKYQYQIEVNFKNNYTYFIKYNRLNEEDDEFDIQGVIQILDLEYQIKGEIEQESEEMELDLTVYMNDGDYVVIEQEKDHDEEQYVYKEYQNHNLTSELSFEYEDDIVEIELLSGNVEGKYTVSYNDGSYLFESDSDIYEGNIKVEISDNQVQYYFINENFKITLEITNKKLFSIVY